MVENKKVVMVGIPGVGKTTLLSQMEEIIKDHHKSVSVLSFGTLMFDIAKENAIQPFDAPAIFSFTLALLTLIVVSLITQKDNSTKKFDIK